MHSALLLIHLVAFAAYIGAGFAQLQLMKRSAGAFVAAAARDELERLSAAVVTKIELPAIFVSVATGVVFVAQNPAYLREGWLHGKLTAVVLLLLLSHAEMFNARRIVRARAERGDGAHDEISARKKKHAAMGSVGSLLVAVVLVMVTFVRLGGS